MPNTPNYMDITSNSYYLLVASGTNDVSSKDFKISFV